MGKNANFVSHKKSKLKENGGPKLPLASDLVEGEIAINFGKDVETLSIKNESGDVVTFSSDNYYTEKKLGSGFTGENSGVTVTEALENIEIAVDQVIDSGTSASTNAVATKAVYEYVTSYTPSITVDQDFSNTASTNPISTKAVYSAITDNELVWTNAFVALSGAVSSHTENTDIHVTAADKARWDSLWESGTGENAIVQKGGGNTASGKLSVAMGSGTTASGNYSIAEGRNTIASSYGSHAEGRYTTASASYSHSEGYGSTASGLYSHAEGSGTIANNKSEHASGQYNVSSSASTTFGYSGNTLFSVGNGTADNARHNAFEIRQNGDVYITSGGTNTSPSIKLQDYIGGSVDTVTAITPSNSGSTDPIATKVIAENEKIVSNALIDLDERKLDVSAYTPTDEASGITAMTGYQIASSSASVLTTDTLLEVIGKLEKRIALLEIALGGLSLVKISTADYENLNPKDPNTLYIFDD